MKHDEWLIASNPTLKRDYLIHTVQSPFIAEFFEADFDDRSGLYHEIPGLAKRATERG